MYILIDFKQVFFSNFYFVNELLANNETLIDHRSLVEGSVGYEPSSSRSNAFLKIFANKKIVRPRNHLDKTFKNIQTKYNLFFTYKTGNLWKEAIKINFNYDLARFDSLS